MSANEPTRDRPHDPLDQWVAGLDRDWRMDTSTTVECPVCGCDIEVPLIVYAYRGTVEPDEVTAYATTRDVGHHNCVEASAARMAHEADTDPAYDPLGPSEDLLDVLSVEDEREIAHEAEMAAKQYRHDKWADETYG